MEEGEVAAKFKDTLEALDTLLWYAFWYDDKPHQFWIRAKFAVEQFFPERKDHAKQFDEWFKDSSVVEQVAAAMKRQSDKVRWEDNYTDPNKVPYDGWVLASDRLPIQDAMYYVTIQHPIAGRQFRVRRWACSKGEYSGGWTKLPEGSEVIAWAEHFKPYTGPV